MTTPSATMRSPDTPGPMKQVKIAEGGTPLPRTKDSLPESPFMPFTPAPEVLLTNPIVPSILGEDAPASGGPPSIVPDPKAVEAAKIFGHVFKLEQMKVRVADGIAEPFSVLVPKDIRFDDLFDVKSAAVLSAHMKAPVSNEGNEVYPRFGDDRNAMMNKRDFFVLEERSRFMPILASIDHGEIDETHIDHNEVKLLVDSRSSSPSFKAVDPNPFWMMHLEDRVFLDSAKPAFVVVDFNMETMENEKRGLSGMDWNYIKSMFDAIVPTDLSQSAASRMLLISHAKRSDSLRLRASFFILGSILQKLCETRHTILSEHFLPTISLVLTPNLVLLPT
jgi:hypothetical protein